MAEELPNLRLVHLTGTYMPAVQPITEVLGYPDIICRNRTGISGG
jgi:hypothetical protein